jgi:hypothetical protein
MEAEKMAKNRVFSSLMFLLLLSVPAWAGDVVPFDRSNVVVITPQAAPVTIASFDGFTDAKKLYIHVSFRNETPTAIDGASMALMVFDANRKVIGAATHRAAGRAGAGETFATEFEMPLMKPADSSWQVMAVPVEAARIGWRVAPDKLRPLVDRLSGARWTGVREALAIGADLIPQGELAQILPPNCTLGQCAANNSDCYSYCYDAIACAYCDRRRTGEGCSTTCYCIGPTQECPPDPYL